MQYGGRVSSLDSSTQHSTRFAFIFEDAVNTQAHHHTQQSPNCEASQRTRHAFS